LTKNPFEYEWSSTSIYFQDKKSFLDLRFVEKMFTSELVFRKSVWSKVTLESDERTSKYGRIMGDQDFEKKAIARYDRRTKLNYGLNRRKSDKSYDPISKLISEFERKIGLSIEKIATYCHVGKKQRGELLVILRDNAGLSYREIYQFDIFHELKFSSLGRLYGDTKKRIKNNT